MKKLCGPSQLLLASLVKSTSSSNPDYLDLMSTLQETKQLNAFLDETKRKEDNKRKVKQILSLLDTRGKRKLPKTLDEEQMKDRIFVREGLLCDTSRKRKKEHYVFMFNDILLKTAVKRNTISSNLNKLGLHPPMWPWENKQGAHYIYKDIIPFSQVFLATELQEGDGGWNVSFQLIERNPEPNTPPCVQTFTCASEDELRSWTKDISEAINLTHVMAQIRRST